MSDRTNTSTPTSEGAYRKRRDSYTAAMSDENPIDEEPTETYRRRDCNLMQPRCNAVAQRRARLHDDSSMESESWSTESSASKRVLSRASSGDTAKSWGDIEIPEILLSHPEILSRMIKCRCFLPRFSYECQCQCRCSQCQYQQRRKISSCSFRESSLSVRRKDSNYSVSTCQSILPASSGRGSVLSLYHCNDIREDRSAESITGEVIQRRHSDQTHGSLRKIGRTDNRRFSEQTLARDAIEYPKRNIASTAKPIIARTCLGFLPKPGAAAKSKQSWTQRGSCGTDASAKGWNEDTRTDLRYKRDRRDSETSVDNSRRNSSTITPKMMRRRFSEQLILEGGLGSVGEFDNPAEDEEESLTVINARKKVTLKGHYYPEGGWGCVIVLVAILVQVISHGLQLGSGVFFPSTMRRFEENVASTGRR